ncbi:MAG: NADH-quinone oxidoreductase subunit L [Verrucomicrobiales bacterium]|jgi:NADH-quinone oxidoreductase subunit L|nr:NADH-quinone oxidoreductase subunit L [Verrucomicrobiales bacterium]
MNWVILLAPLVSAVLITLVLHPLRKISAGVSVLACAVSFAASVKVFLADGAGSVSAVTWLDYPGLLTVTIGALTDHLSTLMLLIVSGVGLCIHIFACGYMKDDPGISRFFAKLSLFMFSMLGIVLADNLVMMFIFWELVGLSSYLLIGFWFERPSAAEAAKKAFIVNRLGDFGFLLGILGVWWAWGTVDFGELKNSVSAAALPAVLAQNPLAVTLIGLGLFMGCIGKSAQFPLHIWLPDAMEGPTPVSALIHAATMVAAGVYMLCRVFFILELSPQTLQIIATIGAITAIFAALIATQQNDIKRILAYSTLSQLGYMVLAVGLCATSAAMFHLCTHAFFKALLFLGAGSVIHALHHEQDIWRMGGLWKKMPITAATFLIGTLALTGCPLLAGFFSKDAILLAALHNNIWIFGVAIITAALTAYYMFRLFAVAFLGQARSAAVQHTHESPPVMTLPLTVLAALAVVGGYLGQQAYLGQPHADHAGGGLVLWLSVLVFALGAVGGLWLYLRAKSERVHVDIFANKFYSDELYQALFVNGQQLLARILDWIDRWIVGGLIVRGLAVLATVSGEILRLVQGGNVQAYATVFILGVIFLCYWVMVHLQHLF